MRSVIFFLLSSVLALAGTPVIVNTASGSNTSGSAVPSIASGAANHTAGNVLLVNFCDWLSNQTSQSFSLADTAGNSYTQLTQYVANSGTDHQQCTWAYSRNIVGNASNVVTATCLVNNCQYPSIVVYQISGGDNATTPPIDAGCSGAGCAGGTSLVTPSFNSGTIPPNQLIIACGYSAYVRPQTWTAGLIGGVSSSLDITATGGMQACESLGASSTQTGVTAAMSGTSAMTIWNINATSFKGTGTAVTPRHHRGVF